MSHDESHKQIKCRCGEEKKELKIHEITGKIDLRLNYASRKLRRKY